MTWSPRSCLVALAVTLGACSSAPASPRSGDDDAVTVMFLETCAPGRRRIEVQVCRCVLDQLRRRLDPNELAALDRRLRQEPDALPPVVAEAALSCATTSLEP